MDRTVPNFINIEGSAAFGRAYPVEVCFFSNGGHNYGAILSPGYISEWLTWGLSDCDVHGVYATDQQAFGVSPFEVARVLASELGGQTAYATSAVRQQQLLDELGSATRTEIDVHINSIDNLIFSILVETLGEVKAAFQINLLQQTARSRVHQIRHRGVWEIKYMVLLWQLATESEGRE